MKKMKDNTKKSLSFYFERKVYPTDVRLFYFLFGKMCIQKKLKMFVGPRIKYIK